VYILAGHFLLVGLDGDWTTRGNDLAFHSIHYLLNRDIMEGKAAIEAAQQGIPDAVKAYRDALLKYQDQLTDAERAIKRSRDDLDVAKRDGNTKLEEDANRRLTEATGKKTEAEGVITPAADQLKLQKATIEGYLNPVLQGRVGGAYKSGFNRMLDGNDVPRFAIGYTSRGVFQIVQHPEVDGLRPWLTIALLLLAALFIVQIGVGAGVIVEKKFAGVKTFFYYFFLETFVLICMLPVIWIMVASFFSETGIKSIISTIKESEIFIKNYISLENYQKNLEGMFLTYFRNSLIVSGVTAVFCGSLGILAGYAFSRFYFPGRRKQMMWILVSQLFPMAMMIVPLYIVSQVLGINKGLFVIIIAYSATSLPFSIWMMKGYFDTVPVSLEEAAAIDGASTARRMWHVLLPLSRPAIATTIFYSFITSWNEFAISSFFLNTKETRTLPVALNAMLDSFNPQYALFSAAGVLASLPVVVLFLYLQKHLVSGLMAGGVKG
jgi:arabinogalactan oligomer/maltooligosaccharide transport system permease protein